MRLVDATQLVFSAHSDKFVTMKELVDAPAIDPVHAAGGCYCGECRKAEYDGGYIWCRGNAVKPNDFCSFGQRKETTYD